VLFEGDATLDASDVAGAGQGLVGRHQVTVGAGDRVRITLTSQAFDPVLLVTVPGGETLSNDDVAGDRTRSELEIIAARAGELKVGVTSYQPGAAGTYHVRIERMATGATAAPRIASAGGAHHQVLVNGRSFLGSTGPAPATAGGAAPAAPAIAPLRVGDRIQANLARGDTTLPSGELADVYELVVTEPTSITLQMQSRAVDSYLLVTTPSGEQLQNDDSGGTRDAQIELQATPGTYRVIATTYRAGETGAYELKALASREAAPQAAAPSGTGGERVTRRVLRRDERHALSRRGRAHRGALHRVRLVPHRPLARRAAAGQRRHGARQPQRGPRLRRARGRPASGARHLVPARRDRGLRARDPRRIAGRRSAHARHAHASNTHAHDAGGRTVRGRAHRARRARGGRSPAPQR
jgi:hypothetical protein